MRKIVATFFVGAVFVFLGNSILTTSAAGAIYFANTVNNDPAEAGNYWNDSGLTEPYGGIPDPLSQEVIVVAGATYDGDAIFSGSATNEGTVTGTATFIDDLSENNGTVQGTKIRRYITSVGTIRDFTVGGPWTVIADGVSIDLTMGATYDITTTLVEENGGTLITPIFYFNNAVNTSPSELGNYWLDSDLTIPAASVPDSTFQIVNVVADATYNGNITFNDTAVNNGTVTGNARFNGTGPENNGTVTGTITRYYTGDVSASNNLAARGPWIVVSDGGVVNLSSGTFDGTTTFTTSNGGSYIGTYFIPSESHAFNSTITLAYGAALDTDSVPATSDFAVLFNGQSVTVSDVDISGVNVVLTMSGISSIASNDALTVAYTVGVNPIRTEYGNLPILGFAATSIRIVIATSNAPAYGTLVGTKLYVTNPTADSVDVVDTTTDLVVTQIAVGSGPFFSATVGKKLYVSNQNSNSISVIDTTTDTVIATIPTVSRPFYATAVGNKVYVNGGSGRVFVVDTVTDTITSTITVGAATYYSALVGTSLYVPDDPNDKIYVIDTTTDTVSTTINTADGPYYLSVSGTNLYVGAASPTVAGRKLQVIDTITNTVTATIAMGSSPYYSAVVGDKLYVNNNDNGNYVKVVDLNTNTVVDTIATGATFGMVAHKDKIYINGRSGGGYNVIDTIDDSLTILSLGGSGSLYSTVVGDKIYVPMNSGGKLAVIDTTTLSDELPKLVSFTSTTASGTYTTGQAINITANFGRTLQAGSTMTVALNTGRSVVLSNVLGATLTGTYTIQSGDTTPDLSVASITSALVSDGTNSKSDYEMPRSQGNFVAENSFISRNIGDSKNIVIGAYVTVAVGTNPYQVTAPVTVSGVDYMYVANQGDGTVSVIRVSDNVVVDTITVGSEPYGISSASVSGTVYMYVANTGSDTVSVISTATNTVTATVAVGVKPYYAATIGTKVYITNGASNTVSVINALNNTVTATIAVGSYPRGIKANGTDLYVANYGDPNYSGGNSISVIDSTSNTVTDTIVLPRGSSGPRGVIVANGKVYVTNYLTHNVSVVDPDTNTITDTISVGSGPRGTAVVGTNVYIENFDDGTISVIDTDTDTVTATVDVGHSPAGMGVTGTDIYVSRFKDNVVSIFNSLTNLLREIDSTDPVISSVASGTPTDSVTTITWTTDEAASTQVSYGATISYGTTTTETDTSTRVTSHSVLLSGLTACTTYHYKVISSDASSNSAESSDATFITTGCPSGGGGGSSSGGGAIYTPVPILPVNLPPVAVTNPPGQNVDTSSPSTLPATYQFTKTYKTGNVSPEVKELQKYLNAHGFLLAKSGPGSPGKETTMFGKATRAALIKFQEKYAKEILVPAGLKKGTGTFGFYTMRYINSHK